MTLLAILAALTPIIVALMPLLGQWLLNKYTKSTTKEAQYEQATQKIDKAIAEGDEDAVNLLLHDSLDRLPDTDRGDSSGQESGARRP